MYVIKNQGRYVAEPGRESSFTTKLEYARKFKTREEAMANACGDEQVVQLRSGWVE